MDNQACGYQNMNVFVREADAAKQDTPILLNVNNSGWFATYQGGKGNWNGTDAITNANYSGADIVNGGTYVSNSDTDKRGAALARGFVYINMASRSRGASACRRVHGRPLPGQGAGRHRRREGRRALPAPERRLDAGHGQPHRGQRHQRRRAPEHAAGRHGDSADYLPYLKAVGAAGVDASGGSWISDSVYAIVAYCPIQDMGSADIAYEWMFNVLDTRKAVSADQKAGLIVDANGSELVRASNPDPSGSVTLIYKFAAYQAGLGLKNDDGTPLTADNMLAALQTEMTKAASAYVKSGKNIVAFNATGSAAANGVAGGSGSCHTRTTSSMSIRVAWSRRSTWRTT